MQIKAVIDRFEGSSAVLFVGNYELPVNWPKTALPENVHEGDVLQITLTIDSEATRLARSEAENLLQRVLQKNQGD